MLEQRQDAAAEQVGRRLVAAEEQQRAHRQQLVARERVVVLGPGPDEVVEQGLIAVAGRVLDQPFEVRDQLGHPGFGPVVAVGVVDRAEDQRGDVGRPGLEAVAVLARHAEHLRDHDRRKRVGKGRDQVDRAGLG